MAGRILPGNCVYIYIYKYGTYNIQYRRKWLEGYYQGIVSTFISINTVLTYNIQYSTGRNGWKEYYKENVSTFISINTVLTTYSTGGYGWKEYYQGIVSTFISIIMVLTTYSTGGNGWKEYYKENVSKFISTNTVIEHRNPCGSSSSLIHYKYNFC